MNNKRGVIFTHIQRQRRDDTARNDTAQAGGKDTAEEETEKTDTAGGRKTRRTHHKPQIKPKAKKAGKCSIP